VSAGIYSSAVHNGFKLRTDTLEVKLSMRDSKDVIEDVMRYMGITGPGVAITEENWAWMMKEEEGDNE